eukprot:Gb_18450 [translate_table: standard]
MAPKPEEGNKGGFEAQMEEFQQKVLEEVRDYISMVDIKLAINLVEMKNELRNFTKQFLKNSKDSNSKGKAKWRIHPRPQKDVNLIALLMLESLGGRDRVRRIMGEHLVTTKPAVLKVDEEVISREKTNQVGQLTKFLKDDEAFCWLQSRIARESLPKPWDKVAVQIMKYLTLEGKFRKIFGYHIAILNSIRNEERINIPLFLLKEQSHEKDKRGTSVGSARSGFPKTSRSPVSKAQLLLGPSPVIKTSAVISNLTEDSKSQGEEIPVESTEEEKEDSDIGKSVDVGKIAKDVGPEIPVKGPVKDPDGTNDMLEDLKCHLKVLNGLGGSLTSTCACINLLTLEITNYLKEVVNNLART